jgi:hypothetical protein
MMQVCWGSICLDEHKLLNQIPADQQQVVSIKKRFFWDYLVDRIFKMIQATHTISPYKNCGKCLSNNK